MKLSKIGFELIKKYESFRSKKYLCPAGKWSIGYGHSLKNSEFQNDITKEKGEELLRCEVKNIEFLIKKRVVVNLNQNQFDALVSLVYNWGSGNFLHSNLLKRLNKGDYNGAILDFRAVIKAKGKVLSGLIRRREEEINLFLKK